MRYDRHFSQHSRARDAAPRRVRPITLISSILLSRLRTPLLLTTRALVLIFYYDTSVWLCWLIDCWRWGARDIILISPACLVEAFTLGFIMLFLWFMLCLLPFSGMAATLRITSHVMLFAVAALCFPRHATLMTCIFSTCPASLRRPLLSALRRSGLLAAISLPQLTAEADAARGADTLHRYRKLGSLYFQRSPARLIDERGRLCYVTACLHITPPILPMRVASNAARANRAVDAGPFRPPGCAVVGRRRQKDISNILTNAAPIFDIFDEEGDDVYLYLPLLFGDYFLLIWRFSAMSLTFRCEYRAVMIFDISAASFIGAIGFYAPAGRHEADDYFARWVYYGLRDALLHDGEGPARKPVSTHTKLAREARQISSSLVTAHAWGDIYFSLQWRHLRVVLRTLSFTWPGQCPAGARCIPCRPRSFTHTSRLTLFVELLSPPSIISAEEAASPRRIRHDAASCRDWLGIAKRHFTAAGTHRPCRAIDRGHFAWRGESCRRRPAGHGCWAQAPALELH